MPERYAPKIATGERPKFTSREDFTSGGFKYPGKLTFNEVTVSQRDGPTNGLLQWEQTIEQQHKQWADGNLASAWNSSLLQYRDKATKEVLDIFEGSDTDDLAAAYEEICGVNMLPDNPDSAAFLNHFFMYESVKVPKTESLYRQIPIEYLGPDFKYEGAVATIGQSQDGATAEAVPVDNAEDAARVADVLVGMTEEDVRGGAALLAIQQVAELKDVRTVLGISLRGGLVQPKAILLDKLIAANLVTIDEGTIMLGAGASDA